jgi:hypothetical protein
MSLSCNNSYSINVTDSRIHGRMMNFYEFIIEFRLMNVIPKSFISDLLVSSDVLWVTRGEWDPRELHSRIRPRVH